MSVMWSRPSMPPRSMNAPKSAMFLTVPLADFADLQAFEGLLLELFALLLDELAAADDDVATLFVNLEDDGVDVAADPVGNSPGRRMSTCEAGRKTGTPISTSKPPLIFLVTLPETGSPFLLGLHDGFPVDDAISLALADLHQTGVAFDVFEQDLDLVADLDVVRVVELAALEDAFALEPQLDDEVIAGVARDFSFDDRRRRESP
jgi:hypothetical protein